jgi:hypothetical protein
MRRRLRGTEPVRYNKETRKGRILPFRCPLRLILFHKNHL